MCIRDRPGPATELGTACGLEPGSGSADGVDDGELGLDEFGFGVGLGVAVGFVGLGVLGR